MQPAPCLDDNNPIGCFGCDKRRDPGFLMRCCCSTCVLLNYEGLSCLAVIALVWVLCTAYVGDIFVLVGTVFWVVFGFG